MKNTIVLIMVVLLCMACSEDKQILNISGKI